MVADEQVEKRVAPRHAWGIEFLHEVVERQILVRERRQIGRPDAVEQLGERRVAREVGPQHHGVDEQSDHVVERGVIAAGHRRADHDVVTRTEPMDQHRDSRVQHHEHADLLVGGQSSQRGGGFGRDLDVEGATRTGGPRGPRPVGGQRQLVGRPGQCGTPELTLPVTELGEHVALPQGVIGVLHNRFG